MVGKLALAFVNFFKEARGRKVVAISKIHGLEPKAHSDFDEDATYQVRWPHFPNDDSFSKEGDYAAKIICLGVDMEDLADEAACKGFRLPQTQQSEEEKPAAASKSLRGRSLASKSTSEKSAAEKCSTGRASTGRSAGRSAAGKSSGKSETGKPKRSSRKSSKVKKNFIESQDKVPLSYHRPPFSSDKDLDSESDNSSTQQHDGPPVHAERKHKLTVSEQVARDRMRKRVKDPKESSIPTATESQPSKTQTEPQDEIISVDSSVSPKVLKTDCKLLTEPSAERVEHGFLNSSPSSSKVPKPADFSFFSDPEAQVKSDRKVDSSPLKSRSSSKVSKPADFSFFSDPEAQVRSDRKVDSSPPKSRTSSKVSKPADFSFLSDSETQLKSDRKVDSSPPKSRSSSKISKKADSSSDSDSTGSYASSGSKANDEAKTKENLFVSKILKLETENKKLLRELISTKDVLKEKEMDIKKLQHLNIKLQEQLFNIDSVDLTKNTTSLETLTSPSPDTAVTSTPKNAEKNAENSKETKHASDAKKVLFSSPAKESFKTSEQLAPMMYDALTKKLSLRSDGDKTNIGNNVWVSTYLMENKILKPNVEASIALRDAMSHVYSKQELAERSLEGGTPVKGDKTLKKKKMTPSKREALLGLYKAKCMMRSKDESYLKLAYKKGKSTMRDKFKESAKKPKQAD